MDAWSSGHRAIVLFLNLPFLPPQPSLGPQNIFQLALSSSIVVESVNADRSEEDGRLLRVSFVDQFLTKNRTRQFAEAESEEIF